MDFSFKKICINIATIAITRSTVTNEQRATLKICLKLQMLVFFVVVVVTFHMTKQ